MRLIQRHDEFAKHILDEPGHADAFIRERLPAAVAQRLSDKPAVDRSASHIPLELQDLRGDRVYAVETTDGDEVLIWTLVEHKASPEPDTLVQLLRDLTGIACKGARRRETADGTVCLVPAPIYVLVLYHGVQRWSLPTELAESYGLSKDLTALGLLSFIYRLIDLMRIPDQALSSQPSLRAVLMVLKYSLYDQDVRLTLDRLIESAAGFGLTTLIVVVRYLVKGSAWVDIEDIRTRVARLMPGEEEKVMSPALKQIMEEARAKYLAEDRPRLLAEERARILAEERPKIVAEERPKIVAEERPKIVAEEWGQVLLRLLERKFGPLSAETVERVRAADRERLEAMMDNFVDAKTLEDVLGPQRLR